MTKLKRWVLVGMLAAMPLAASACKINVGSGCTALIFEPGIQFGVICNPL
jgi:hypothetical protein